MSMVQRPVMLAAFGLFLRRSLMLCGWLLRGLPADNPAGQIRRLLLLLFGLPLFWLLQLSHWLGFLLDELLFRDYRQVAVRRPVFIVGVPRSGTTVLQRTLASDPDFTTMSTWECVLAPSISERYCYRALARLLRPLRRRGLRLPLVNRLQSIHAIDLAAPEEDFLVLMPLLACFLLVVLFPNARDLRRLAFFDQTLPVAERRLIMNFYYRCLQRHLYFHGADKRYLAKNPSFTPMLGSLQYRFRDAHFIACTRDPAATVPSQLSALRPALGWCGFRSIPRTFRDFLLSMLHFYYEQLNALNRHQPDKVSLVEMNALRDDLQTLVTKLYRDMRQAMTAELEQTYRQQSEQVQQYRSQHRYRMHEFDLDQQWIIQRFSDVWPVYQAGSG